MKKSIFTLIVLSIIIFLSVAYFVFKPSQVTVSISEVKPSNVEIIKAQFAENTGNKLRMICQTMEQDSIECTGSYTADNLVQLVRYQNIIFKLAQDNNITLVAGGSFAANLMD